MARGTESLESIQTRLDKAKYELSFRHSFNKIIVNDVLQEACEKTEGVVRDFLGIQVDC
jgi:guanylate kinase